MPAALVHKRATTQHPAAASGVGDGSSQRNSAHERPVWRNGARWKLRNSAFEMTDHPHLLLCFLCRTLCCIITHNNPKLADAKDAASGRQVFDLPAITHDEGISHIYMMR